MLNWKTLAKSAALALALVGPAHADVLVDPDFGFQVEIPDTWVGERAVEGDDRVLKFQSADGLSYGEVRVFALEADITAQQLRMAFEQGAMAEAEFIGADSDMVNGLPGEVAAWRMYSGGYSTIVGAFFSAYQGHAYILLTIVDEANFATYSPVFDQIFGSLVPVTQGAGAGGLSLFGQGAGSQGLPQIDRTGTALLQGLMAEPHPELGFVVVHSEAWEADQPTPYSLRIAAGGLHPSQQPSILIEALSGAAYPSLQAFASDLKSQLAGEPGIRFEQEGPYGLETLILDGVPLQGWTFTAKYMLDGMPFDHQFLLFYRQDPAVYYGVYLAGPQNQMDVYKEEMMNIVMTMQMIPFGS